jgi:hypothetical protein
LVRVEHGQRTVAADQRTWLLAGTSSPSGFPHEPGTPTLRNVLEQIIWQLASPDARAAQSPLLGVRWLLRLSLRPLGASITWSEQDGRSTAWFFAPPQQLPLPAAAPTAPLRAWNEVVVPLDALLVAGELLEDTLQVRSGVLPLLTPSEASSSVPPDADPETKTPARVPPRPASLREPHGKARRAVSATEMLAQNAKAAQAAAARRGGHDPENPWSRRRHELGPPIARLA